MKSIQFSITVITIGIQLVLSLNSIGQNTVDEDFEPELSITQGDPAKAKILSTGKKAVVIHISTGTKEMKYTATQYAEMLHPMFLDSNLAHPTNVLFVVESTDKNRYDAAYVDISGVSYNPETKKIKAGYFPLHPYAIPENIPAITQAYHKLNGAYGIQAVLKDSVLERRDR